MSTSALGYTRSAADVVAKRKPSKHILKTGGTRIYEAVSYSSAGTNAKYLDSDTGDSIVCGGYVKHFTGIGLGVLLEDTKDGDVGEYMIDGVAWVELTTGQTPANNTVMYWDTGTGTGVLTTASGGGLRVGTITLQGVGEATYEVVSTATFTSRPAGTWAILQLQPVQ